MGSSMMQVNFDERPFVVIWEVTRACALACRHCRAEAIERQHPLELDFEQSVGLIDQVVRCRPMTFVLTGGTRCGGRTWRCWSAMRRRRG